MTFRRPTLEQLTAQTETEIRARLGIGPLLRRSVLAVLARVMAGLAHSGHGFVAWIARQILPDTADGEFLERHGSLRGVNRKVATFATGAAALTGTSGSTIPSGVQLRRADGALYQTTETATLAGGSALVDVEAVEPGSASNAPSGTGVTLTTPVLGVDAGATLSAVEGGEDTETDAQLRARVLDVWRRQPHAGTEADYERWALEVPGVTRAFAYGRRPTVGQVTVFVVCDGNQAGPEPTTAQLAAVQEHIDALRPVAARAVVRAPTFVPLDLTLELSPDSSTVRAQVDLALARLIESDARPGGHLRRSRISEAISAAPGEVWHRLAVPAADVQIGDDEVLVPGEVTWV